eukprot:TRINITY_DN1699_c0_g1_i4.p1 TRINITY_DN1699_c0_g1~~TRINITY_DN1699_c0_g1_i4.p1  ORF type:complete len:1644 (+),score=334.76 TRINITY_DN1699_c0_g1_i4:1616-6547(+)
MKQRSRGRRHWGYNNERVNDQEVPDSGPIPGTVSFHVDLKDFDPQTEPFPTSHASFRFGEETSDNGSDVDDGPVEGSTGSPKDNPPKETKLQKVSDEEYKLLAKRLPEFGKEDAVDFKLRAKSLKPPRGGKELDVPFPPSTKRPPQTPEGEEVEEDDEQEPPPALTIEHNTPTGVLSSFTSEITILFSQEMIPLSTVGSGATTKEIKSKKSKKKGSKKRKKSAKAKKSIEIPVVIEPAVTSGRWRWIDTKQLRYEAVSEKAADSQAPVRLSGATKYTVTVPCSQAKSLIGGKLEKDFFWSFCTPRVRMVSSGRTSSDSKPIFWIEWNQPIVPKDVLACGALHKQRLVGLLNGQQFALELVDPSTVTHKAFNEAVGRIETKFGTDHSRLLVFRPKEDLPVASSFQIKFTKVPAKEGSLLSVTDTVYSFSTYGPLRLDSHYPKKVYPQQPAVINLYFSNVLANFTSNLVTVEPMLKHQNIVCHGSHISVTGTPEIQKTTYKITLDAAISDNYGQTLGTGWTGKYTASFKTYPLSNGPQELRMCLASGIEDNTIILDPDAVAKDGAKVSFLSYNYSEFRVVVYGIDGAWITQYARYCSRSNDESEPFPILRKFKICDSNFTIADLKRKTGKNEESNEDAEGPVNENAREYDFVDIDLAPHLRKRRQTLDKNAKVGENDIPFGHLVVFIEPTRRAIFKDNRHKYHYPNCFALVSYTAMAADLLSLRTSEFVVLATSLSTGKPLKGIEVRVPYKVTKNVYSEKDYKNPRIGTALQTKTDKRGLAVFHPKFEPATMTLAPGKDEGTDTSWCNSCLLSDPKTGDSIYMRDNTGHDPPREISLLNHTMDDRHVYRPKETVSVKGFVRYYDAIPTPLISKAAKKDDNKEETGSYVREISKDIVVYDWQGRVRRLALPPKKDTILATVADPRGNEIAKLKKVKVSKHGTFQFSFPLPDNANLGTARITLTLKSRDTAPWVHQFEIQEFRRPEFKISSLVLTPPPYFATPPSPLYTSQLITAFNNRAAAAAKAAAAKAAKEEETEGDNSKKAEQKTEEEEDDEVEEEEGPSHNLVATVQNFSIVANAKAEYFTGGGLAGAKAKWVVKHRPSPFSALNFALPEGFSYTPDRTNPYPRPVLVKQLKDMTTKESGAHHVRIELQGSENPPGPVSLSAEATILDLNNQSLVTSQNILIHPSRFYVTLHLEKSFITADEDVSVDALVVDYNGTPVTDQVVPVYFHALLRYRDMTTGAWQNQDVYTIAQTDQKTGKVQWVFSPESAGATVQIDATCYDPEGRATHSELTLNVAGGWEAAARLPESVDDPLIAAFKLDSLEIILDKDSYDPTETAKVLVKAPFTPCEGILTMHKDEHLIQAIRFSIGKTARKLSKKQKQKQKSKNKASTAAQIGTDVVLEIDLGAHLIPRAVLHGFVVGNKRRDVSAEKDGFTQPAEAIQSDPLSLIVRLDSRRLKLDVEPASERVSPGSKTFVDVKVSDYRGNAAPGAEVHLIVVDEAVLSLTGHTLADPLSVFYPNVVGSFIHSYSRQNLLLKHLPEFCTQPLTKQIADGDDDQTRGGEDGEMEEYGDDGLSNGTPLADCLEASEGRRCSHRLRGKRECEKFDCKVVSEEMCCKQKKKKKPVLQQAFAEFSSILLCILL